MLTRLRITFFLLLLAFVSWSCGGEDPIGPTPPRTGSQPSPSPTPSGPVVQPPQLQAIGCSLQGASASAANLGALAAAGQIYFPSGNPRLDNFLQSEGIAMVNTFFLFPRMFILMDTPSPNAFATPEVAHVLGPDGTILFGQRMMSEQLQRDPNGGTVVAIMAHEFGHLAQFIRGGFRETGKRPELHADFMAG